MLSNRIAVEVKLVAHPVGFPPLVPLYNSFFEDVKMPLICHWISPSFLCIFGRLTSVCDPNSGHVRSIICLPLCCMVRSLLLLQERTPSIAVEINQSTPWTCFFTISRPFCRITDDMSLKSEMALF